eukprot:TRINITY_DN57917_c0_g1_i1.p1 TRINITY_DN57917_c0_g1~~TRINITY_DN57917_c0_g1_i1.p1  ORF type:complete len:463 (-),score=82.76 TRINITY_DN57917_c0_g1_i1:198-1526(-)
MGGLQSVTEDASREAATAPAVTAGLPNQLPLSEVEGVKTLPPAQQLVTLKTTDNDTTPRSELRLKSAPTAPRPVTCKVTGNDSRLDLGLLWGIGEMQGWRPTMEDAHVATTLKSGKWAGTGLFGVFDGHGGASVAKFSARNLPKLVVAGRALEAEDALKTSFEMLDKCLENAAQTLQCTHRSHPSKVGCTAVTCLVRRRDIIVANAGDSRVVLSCQGTAIDLSQDHKPSLPEEKQRIGNAGGFVVDSRVGPYTVSRVNGELSLSRAIGDLRFKQDATRSAAEQIVTCVPDVRTYMRNPEDEFLIIACDGVWDVLSSQDVVDRVHKHLPEMRRGELQPSDVVSQILDECLATDPRKSFGKGGDNMTMIIVVMQEPRKHVLTRALSSCLRPVRRVGSSSTAASAKDSKPQSPNSWGAPVLLGSQMNKKNSAGGKYKPSPTTILL